MTKFISYSAIAMAVLSLTACGNKKNKAPQTHVQSVPTIKVETRDVTTFKSYPTNIEGIINSDIRPKISGYIINVLVDEGQKVHKGQLLFKLETQTLSQQADAAKANVNAAQVEVNQLKPLVAKNIVSASKLATAKAKLEQAKSSYQSVMANISYANIKSPVNGYVGMIRLRKGNLVSPAGSQALTTVTDISQVYAYFSMNEKDYLDFLLHAKGETRAEKINNMPKVTLVLANGDIYQLKGTIQAINSQINKQTGTVSFRAVFDNPNRILTNGSTGIIRVPKTYKNILVVPQESTYEQQGLVHVMEIKRMGDSTISVSKVIHVEDRVRGLYLIDSGLSKGDEIIAIGVEKIQSGSPVKPQEVPFDSVAKPLPVVF